MFHLSSFEIPKCRKPITLVKNLSISVSNLQPALQVLSLCRRRLCQVYILLQVLSVCCRWFYQYVCCRCYQKAADGSVQYVWRNDLISINKPIGFLPQRNHCPDFYRSFFDTFTIDFPTVKYKFSMHSHLRLNLSFHYIAFTSKPDDHCQQGHISIKQTNVSNIQKYCGLHSAFIVYSYSEDAEMKIFPKNQNFFVTSASYSVIDIGKVSNTIFLHPILRWCFNFHMHEISMERVFVKVGTFHHVHIFAENTSGNTLDIHDGPGTKCPKLVANYTKSNQSYFVASTFQALIIVFFRKSSKSIAYRSQAVIPTKVITVKHDTKVQEFLGNSHICQTIKVCFLKFSTKNTLKLNLTMYNFAYKGSHMMGNCSYAGLAVMDSDNGHLTTECVQTNFYRFVNSSGQVHSFSNYTYFGQNDVKTVYSSQNEMSVLLFNYKEYGILTVSVDVETTDFRIITIDICATREEIQPTHNIRSFTPNFHFMELNCKEYDKLLVQISHITISSYRELCIYNIFCNLIMKVGKRVSVVGIGVMKEGATSPLGKSQSHPRVNPINIEQCVLFTPGKSNNT